MEPFLCIIGKIQVPAAVGCTVALAFKAGRHAEPIHKVRIALYKKNITVFLGAHRHSVDSVTHQRVNNVFVLFKKLFHHLCELCIIVRNHYMLTVHIKKRALNNTFV